jgi:hypothetical protein
MQKIRKRCIEAPDPDPFNNKAIDEEGWVVSPLQFFMGLGIFPVKE